MSTGAEFAARMIYLGYTFHLEASAISHVEQTDLSLMKRLLDWINFEFIRVGHLDLTQVNDLQHFERQKSIIREQLIPKKWRDSVSAELPAIKYPPIIE